MNIKDFAAIHGGKVRSIQELTQLWQTERQVDNLLNTLVAPGIMVSDLLLGQSLVDHKVLLSKEVQESFANLMTTKADTYEEMRKRILAIAERGQENLEGLISKIQGQFGENLFLKAAGAAAKLPESGSQPVWDVSIHHDDHVQYVQVKVYDDARSVIKEIESAMSTVAEGGVAGVVPGEHLSRIDFAVNSDIYEEVSAQVKEKGLDITIYNIGKTHDEIRTQLETEFSDVVNHSVFDDLFSELMGGIMTAGAIHAVANAYAVCFKSKSINQAFEDALYSTTISGSGIGAGMLTETILSQAALLADTEKVLAILTGPVGGIVSISVGMGTKAVLKRILDRRFVATRFGSSVEQQRNLCLRLQNCG